MNKKWLFLLSSLCLSIMMVGCNVEQDPPPPNTVEIYEEPMEGNDDGGIDNYNEEKEARSLDGAEEIIEEPFEDDENKNEENDPNNEQ